MPFSDFLSVNWCPNSAKKHFEENDEKNTFEPCKIENFPGGSREHTVYFCSPKVYYKI